jgi:hypothetical protein
VITGGSSTLANKNTPTTTAKTMAAVAMAMLAIRRR